MDKHTHIHSFVYAHISRHGHYWLVHACIISRAQRVCHAWSPLFPQPLYRGHRIHLGFSHISCLSNSTWRALCCVSSYYFFPLAFHHSTFIHSSECKNNNCFQIHYPVCHWLDSRLPSPRQVSQCCCVEAAFPKTSSDHSTNGFYNQLWLAMLWLGNAALVRILKQTEQCFKCSTDLFWGKSSTRMDGLLKVSQRLYTTSKNTLQLWFLRYL